MICMMCGDSTPMMHHLCNSPNANLHQAKITKDSVNLNSISFVPKDDNKVAIIFGTYNRLPCLKKAIDSIISTKADTIVSIYIVDGGSKDGTLEYLDSLNYILNPRTVKIKLIKQNGELTGAVRAFNLGFKQALDDGNQWFCHFNDDAEFVTKGIFQNSIAMMLADPKIGEVAFEFDLSKYWGFYQYNGKTYANYGIIRREAGIAVAKAQGDNSGTNWWNTIYKTYGADGEFGLQLWKLGWKVAEGLNLRVHDNHHKDELRRLNTALQEKEAKIFFTRCKELML